MRALLKRFRRSRGPVGVEINEHQWDPQNGGMLRALVKGSPGGILVATSLGAPEADIAPVGLSSDLYVMLDCRVEERWRGRGVGTRLVSEALTRMKLVLPEDTVLYGWVPSERPRTFWQSFGFVIVVNPTSGKVLMQARLIDTVSKLPEARVMALMAEQIDYGVITSAYGPIEDAEDADRDVGRPPR